MGRKILLVEDDRETASYLLRGLSEEGHTVEHVDEVVGRQAAAEHVVPLQQLVQRDAVDEAAETDAEGDAGGDQRAVVLFVHRHERGSFPAPAR